MGTINGLAAVTTKLRLGTMVSPATFRHPSELARVVATADHVSGGRVELGLGAGWHEEEHRRFGFPFAPLRERMDVLSEQLEIVHRTWTEGPFSFAGEHYRLEGCDAQPRPVQSPHPPLILGGSARPRGAALAARWADEYNTIFAPPAEVGERRRRVEEACARAGRPMLTFSLMTQCVVGADRGEVDRRRRLLAERTGREPEARSGSTLVGTVDEVAERLHEYEAVGVERVMLQHLLHEDLEMVALIGRELAPAVA